MHLLQPGPPCHKASHLKKIKTIPQHIKILSLLHNPRGLTCPSSSLRSEVLTSAPSLISGSKKSLSHVMKKEPKNFCISTVTYMDTGMMKLKSTMKDRKSVNILRYWWGIKEQRYFNIFLHNMINWGDFINQLYCTQCLQCTLTSHFTWYTSSTAR